MKKSLFLIMLFAFCISGSSQNYLGSDYAKQINVDENGSLKFLSFKSQVSISVADSEALLKSVLSIDEANELQKTKSEIDIFNGQHDIYKQYYNNVEVEFNKYTVHSKNGRITSVNGAFKNIHIQNSLSQLKSDSDILKIGLKNLGERYTVNDVNEIMANDIHGKLSILPTTITHNQEDRYVYVYKLASSNPDGLENIYFDAISGNVLFKDVLFKNHASSPHKELNEEQKDYVLRKTQKNLLFKKTKQPSLAAGTAETKYSGTKDIETLMDVDHFILTDENKDIYTKNIQNTDPIIISLIAILQGMDAVDGLCIEFEDNDNTWTTLEHSNNKDDAALDVHWGVSNVYDFFDEVYERDSFDNLGAKIRSYAHAGNQYVNAGWLSLSASEGGMIYGDGNYDPQAGTGNYDALVSIDVTAHELGHAVDGAEGNLAYERESGAIDEGLADIWGASIEEYAAPEKEEWLIGEEFVVNPPHGIRSMSEPKMFNQPNTYLGEFWKDVTTAGCPTPDRANDYCGVHTNSGVLNYWFYLLSEGGAGTNDINYAYAVSGIGMEAARDIVYATETSYIHSNTTYEEMKDFTIEVATQIYGEKSPEVLEVEKSWCAVGILTSFCDGTVGVEDLNTVSFSIYPNPATNELHIISQKTVANLKYTITNVIGQRINNGIIVNNKINVSSLPKGVYILSLEGENTQKFNHKFIKE